MSKSFIFPFIAYSTSAHETSSLNIFLPPGILEGIFHPSDTEYDVSTGEHCPLRITGYREKRPEDLTTVSPIDTSRKYEAFPTVKKKDHILFGTYEPLNF